MQVVLIEDKLHGRFGPLTMLRPEFDLRCGIFETREKLELRRPDWQVLLLPRPELAELVFESHPGRGAEHMESGRTLLLYGRVLPDERLLAAVAQLDGDAVLLSGAEVVGAFLEDASTERLAESGVDVEGVQALGLARTVDVPARTVRFPWDLVALTPDEIASDAALAMREGPGIRGALDGCVVLGEDGAVIGEGSRVGPGAVLDARGGPVVLGRNVEVMPNAVIIGPAAIGDDTIVRAGAVIYGGTSIGPVCKVGGEIQASVLQSYSNKQHGGFLGHSFVGSWVNLGAATDNSDLKNNYGNVRAEIQGELVDTGWPSVGAVIGDHSKTAIGTKLNTGTVVGIFCNVIAEGFPPKSILSFSWGAGGGFVRHELENALRTARIVMERRGRELTPALEARVRELHALRA